MSYRSIRFSLAFFVLATAASAGDVFVVTPNQPTGDFAVLQDAVNAASDGDVILVRNTTPQGSASVVIDNKSLTLVEDPLATLPFRMFLTIRNLPGNKQVQVSGMGGPLAIENAQGDVLIQDYSLSGTNLESPAVISGSANVVFVRSGFQGDYGVDGPGETGCHIEQSNVTMYACTSIGGDGGIALCLDQDPVGGDGVTVVNNSTLRAFDCVFGGGWGGFSGCSNFFPPGDDLSTSANSTFVELSMAICRLDGPAVVREGEAYSFAIEGPVGQSANLLVSTESQGRALTPSIGVLHLTFPVNLFPMGPVLPSGMTSLDFTAPNIGAGDESRLQYDQGLLVAGTQRYLTNPRFLVVIDASL